MQSPIKDDKLTLFVMGELDEAESARLEEAMQNDPALQAEVDELRTFCQDLQGELQQETLPVSDPADRLRLQQATAGAGDGTGGGFLQRLVSGWKLTIPVLATAAVAGYLYLESGDDAEFVDVAKETRFVPAVQVAEDEGDGVALSEEVASPAPRAEVKKKPKAMTPSRKVVGQFKGLRGSAGGGIRAKSSGGPGILALQYGGGIGAGAPGRGFRGGAVLPGAKGDVPHNTEDYDHIAENPFRPARQDPLSTFSVDVDTASWSNVRRILNEGRLPPADAVRIEEMINYFRYDYRKPAAGRPFSVNVEVGAAPWRPEHRLVRIGLRGKDFAAGEHKGSNLVFLIDVSGSMEASNKLPLLKKSLKMLVEKLGPRDRVGIVVYAGSSGVVLPSTPVSNRQAILDAFDGMRAGGSTNGGAGIQAAYDLAAKSFIKGGVNRVIIATDGDFNVGTADRGSLVRMIKEKAGTGVELSVLGFGMGNYKDGTLEKLAQHGNGNYAYIDSPMEARKVLVQEVGGTLVTIAKDVKLQVEFNPEQVTAYRLIGYENRILAHQDFNDDKKDAGEIGAGHTVTALYEVVPAGVDFKVPGIDPLKYQAPLATRTGSSELATVKLRYKNPGEKRSNLLEYALEGTGASAAPSTDFRFASAVAAFGMILRDSSHKGAADLDRVLEWARQGRGEDAFGYREGFIAMVQKAITLQAGKE